MTKPNRRPSGRRSDNSGVFVKRIEPCCAIWHSPAELPPRPRDENLIFVTNCISPTALLPLHNGGRQCDCRRRHKRFSSRFFLLGELHPDPLHYPAVSTYLEFSYSAIPKRRIRTGCRLNAGAKMGRNFRHETGRSVNTDLPAMLYKEHVCNKSTSAKRNKYVNFFENVLTTVLL